MQGVASTSTHCCHAVPWETVGRRWEGAFCGGVVRGAEGRAGTQQKYARSQLASPGSTEQLPEVVHNQVDPLGQLQPNLSKREMASLPCSSVAVAPIMC